MADVQDNRFIPVHADPFIYPLPNFAKVLAGSDVVKVVAIGSSSTAGEGSIVPYPVRLETNLRAKYHNRIVVLNRGVSGEEAPQERDRMTADVIRLNPALAIWQVGTNAVWQLKQDVDIAAAAIRDGLALLADQPIDVVLMDPQYSPALLTDDKIDDTRRMLSMIAQAAQAAKVNVFRRFDMMRKWHEIEKFSFDTIMDMGDYRRLHQSDYSAQRIGWELCEAIAAAAGSKA
jgi:GDSL-like lipase/acylhydrolase family protein